MKRLARKEMVTGAEWELRVKLKEPTSNIFHALKAEYEKQDNKVYSCSAFFAKLLSDIHLIQKRGLL